MILKATQAADGRLSGTFAEIDESPETVSLKSVSLEGNTFKFDFDGTIDRYEGSLGEDGNTISGLWYSARHPGTTHPIDLHLATSATAWPLESSPHRIQFVTVADGLKLEVLDWGGAGRPLVFLAGLGNDAHIFDKFAPKFTPAYHVYGITRRGYGTSSAPEPANGNYSADQLGDDVLAVIASLKLDRPVLVGHSIAGEELSSVGSRHPGKVAGLIYLDAAYDYAFYDPAHGNYPIDAREVEEKIIRLESMQTSQHDSKVLVRELLNTDLPQLAKALRETEKLLDARPDHDAVAHASAARPDERFAQAILAGTRKYTEIRCPVLAIYAIPPPPDPAKDGPFSPTEAERAWAAAQANAFEAGVPTAHVVRIQNAEHYVFKSNEADVLREMNDFLAKLP